MLSRVRISGRLEGVFTLLPVARAQFVGLQRIEYAQHFLRTTADVQVGDVDEADDALRIDDEGGALRDAGLGIEDAECAGQLALYVRQHRKRQVTQLVLPAPPGKMHVLAIDAHTVQLRITRAELLVELAEGGNLGRADEGEVLRPEEHHLPLAGGAVVAEGPKSVLRITRNDAGERERGEFLANT